MTVRSHGTTHPHSDVDRALESHVDVDLVIVGAGVAGLTVAFEAARAGLRVVLVEASERIGGMLRRGDLAGIPVDLGAESFATRTSGVADLVADAGFDLEIAAPAPGGAHVAFADVGAVGGVALAPLPRQTVLGIPADPGAADVVAILGVEGARRVAAETALPGGAEMTVEPSLFDLVATRCGALLAERLVDPLCRSVYSVAADEARLSRLHPAMWREFRRTGSLVAAAAAVAPPVRTGSAVAGVSGGMWRLAQALHDAVVDLGVRVVTQTTVHRVGALESDDVGSTTVRVELDDARLHARAAVIATGTAAAQRLLGVGGAASDDDTAVRVVAALVDCPPLDAHPVGSGVIVAPGAPSPAKALTHVSAKWPWMAAASRRHVVRLSARDASATGLDSDADIAAAVSRLTGVPITVDAVVATTSITWKDAVATPPVTAERMDELARAGIHLAGAAASGTGLASVIPHARALATRIVEHRLDQRRTADDSHASSPWRTA